MEERTKQLAIKSIRKLSREHKDNCNSEDCEIYTHLIGLAVEELLGRTLTSEELEDFM